MILNPYPIIIKSPLYLYNYGDLCEDVTGGFTQTTSGNYYGYPLTGTVVFNNDSIYIAIINGNELPFVNTVNKIDFSNFKKLKVSYKDATIGVSDSSRMPAIWLTSAVGKSNMQDYQVKYKQIPAGSGTIEMDITQMTGSYYLCLSTDSDYGICATITNIWLT